MSDYEEDNSWEGNEYPESPEGEPVDTAAMQTVCLEAFSAKDYIMEPEVFNMLKSYFSVGGAPELVVRLLSENYRAVAQTANLIADMLISAGVDIKEVQELVESHLKEIIMKCFDPKKADSIFMDEGQTPAWLAEMIEYPTWRNLFYRLAEEYPECLMLNFTIKLISDAGYQGEIRSVSTACHQIEVFSKVLRTSVYSFLEGGEDAIEKNLAEFTKMVCHGEHTYLYSQLVMHSLAMESKGGSNVRRLYQEVHQSAKDKGLDVTPINLALSGAAAYPRACQSLSSMLSRGALNPADICVLYKMYTSNDPPPVDMIRSPQFLDLFLDSIFKPGAKVNQEHKAKYLFLLSYASCAVESWKKGMRKAVNKDDLKPTSQAIDKVHTLCSENKGSSELIADVGTLFQCIKYPVVAMGVLKWVDYTVSEKNYFQLSTDHTPLHLVLLDEISSKHVLLHTKVLELLIRLFESSFDELDVLVQLELKKTLTDRMVHLLTCGCVIPVVSYMKTCWQRGDTDVSLIRHFVTEVLDVISPPYTADFVQYFLPMLDNDEVTGSLRNDSEGNDPVSEFIIHCRSSYMVTL